jgi:general secretion pathway protein L
MTTLTVVLPWDKPTKTTEFPYALSEDDRTVQSHGAAALALLPAARQVHLLVPAGRLSWFSLKLPPVGGARMRQVLEGLLEERLLDEPGHTALAVAGAAEAQGQTLVAACEKAWLAEVLALFEQAQRPASRVVPEFAPTQAAGVYRLVATGGDEQPWLVLCSPADCLQVPLSQAPLLLAHAGGAFDEAALRADPDVAADAEALLGRPRGRGCACGAVVGGSACAVGSGAVRHGAERW